MTRDLVPSGRTVGLGSVLRRCRLAFVGVALISGMVNLLYLTGSFFMLQVYDRVIPSRSLPTLLALSALAFALYLFQGFLDFVRGRVLTRIAGSVDRALSPRVFHLVMRLPLRSRPAGDGLQPLRDLDGVRAFLTGPGVTTFFDLPWMPIYLFFCFLFHPYIGWAVVIGAAILAGLTVLTDAGTRAPVRASVVYASRRNALAEAGRRNAEAVAAMGLGPGLARLFAEVNRQHLGGQQRASDIGGGFGAVSKAARMSLQSAVLALGAYLVIEGQATGGIIIASSILTSRALAPIELAIANWKGFVAARQGARRLSELLDAMPEAGAPLALPAPVSSLVLEGVGAAPPGVPRLVVQDVSVRLAAGQGLGVIGPSASGKSSLARVLVGAWAPVRGKVRIDGAAFDQWDPDALGQHIGFLPQEVELFAGTVADNISRFAAVSDDAAVIAAARAAGVHDLVLRLPEGYGTPIGESGGALSAGQRQRVGLARALYGDPFLVVLDEPNSNLDGEGEYALTQAIQGIRDRGGIVVVIAHRPSALAAVDQVLVMADGKAQALGPKDEILAKLLRPQVASAATFAPPAAAPGGAVPLRVV